MAVPLNEFDVPQEYVTVSYSEYVLKEHLAVFPSFISPTNTESIEGAVAAAGPRIDCVVYPVAEPALFVAVAWQIKYLPLVASKIAFVIVNVGPLPNGLVNELADQEVPYPH